MGHLERVPLLAAFALLAVTPSISGASVLKSGVQGSVSRGPTQPVCAAEMSCSAPVAGASLTFAHGSVTRHARTDAAGRYSIRLAPGRYVVRVSGAHFGYSPRAVTVRAGRMSVLNIQIDTGIR